MTDAPQDQPRSRSYRPGGWFGIIGDNASVLLPPSEKGRVAALWELVDDGAGFDVTLDALISSGLRELSGFVLVAPVGGETRIVLRGPATATLHTDAESVVLEGSTTGTWTERSLPGVTAVSIDVEDTTSAATYVVDRGLVRLSSLDDPSQDTAVVLTPTTVAAASEALADPVDAGGSVDAGAPDEVVAPVEVGPGVERLDEPAEALPIPASEPLPSADFDPDLHTGAAAALFGPPPVSPPPMMPPPAYAPPVAAEPPAYDPPAEPPAYEPQASPAYDPPDAPVFDSSASEPEPVTEAIALEEIPAAAPPAWAPAPPPPAPIPPAAPAYPPAPPVDTTPPVEPLPWGQVPPSEPGPSAEDEADHDGLTRVGASSELGAPLPGIPGQPQAPGITARPVARLYFSTGDVVDVDRVVLVGRAPEARQFAAHEQPRLVSVPSPNQEISSTHLEIRPGSGADHGSAVVTDLGSTNGTFITQPGLAQEELPPAMATQLIPGAEIDLGDGVTIRVTNA